MRTLELFSGTGSFSKVAEKLGYKTFMVDKFENTGCDLVADLGCMEVKDFIEDFGKFEFIWASPPCTAFSVASIGRNWDKETRNPKTENAKLGLKLLDQTIKWILEFKPKYWIIENPRGMMRKKIDEVFKKYNITDYERKTITYCQYGDTRMKPTDLWTNIKN